MAKTSERNIRYLKAEEVATLYRTSRWQVYEWARRGVIPSECVIRLGRKILFDAEVMRAVLPGGAHGHQASS